MEEKVKDQKAEIVETELALTVKLVNVKGVKNGKPYEFTRLVISDGHPYGSPDANENLNKELNKIGATVSGYFLQDLKNYEV